MLVDLLAIDAWHQRFNPDKGSSSVHVELSFREGRIGDADEDFPFTFRISLKKALLTIKVEEPLTIDRGTIARHIPVDQTERTTISTIRDTVKKDRSAGGKFDISKLAVAINASKGSSQEVTREDQIKATQSFPRIVVSSIPCSRSEYCWELSPGNSATLEGQPWDPHKEPRLSVKNFDPTARIDPAIKVLITCAVEDLVIDELIPKKDGVIDKFKELILNEVNYKAAIQHLKHVLRETDIEVGQVASRFSDLIIADILATEE